MSEQSIEQVMSRRYLQLGIFLFLMGLVTGFGLPLMENPRMGLASHLEGVLNGVFLVVLGLMWHRVQLSVTAQRVAFGLVVYGTFANWMATLLGAIWGAGTMMPIAGLGHQGTSIQESVIGLLLFSLSAAMLVVCLMVLWGLRKPRAVAPARADLVNTRTA
jgi:hydroxylaminobenzene mutase